MFDNIIENTKRNISSATLMAIAITILESYFLIKGNFPISYTILCAILFYVGWVVFCSIALSILKTIIALILWIIEEIKKPQTCTNQEVKPSELPHPIFDDDIVIKTLPKRIWKIPIRSMKIFKNKDFHPRTKRAFLIQSIECIGKALCVLENRYNF